MAKQDYNMTNKVKLTSYRPYIALSEEQYIIVNITATDVILKAPFIEQLTASTEKLMGLLPIKVLN